MARDTASAAPWWSRLSLFSGSSKYDHLRNSGKREAITKNLRSEDWDVRDHERQLMSSSASKVIANYSVAAWAVRKHLDYTTSFDFSATTRDDAFNTDLEGFMRRWSKRTKCDASRKHPLRRLIRIAEQCRCTGGDVFLLKVGGDGPLRGSLQIIESERVKNPTGIGANGVVVSRRDIPQGLNTEGWNNGVRLSPRGVASEIAIHGRTGAIGQLEFEKTVNARNVLHHGFFHRADQVRGISPIMSALSTFQDIYETMDYAISGVKAAQLVGIFIKRAWGQGSMNDMRIQNNPTAEVTDEQRANYYRRVKFGNKPMMLQGLPGDEAQFIDAKKPAVETTQFLDMLTHVAIKCFDIPKSFWDETVSNYSSARFAKIEFNKSIEEKRQDVADLLDDITRWRLGMAVADGEVRLPAGMAFDDVRWQWRQRGTPYVDPLKEVNGKILEIANGLNNPYRACAHNGTDFEDNVRAISRAKAFAESNGVTLSEAMITPDAEDSDG